ncbi:MAG: nitroreductase/quinone reductase family protein [Acidimicrobiia bacterium]
MYRRHRRKGYRFMGADVLFLTTIGRRTGERRETAVSWCPDGQDAWLIVASAAGKANNPDWYYNIADPDQVWIELPQRRLRVTPEELEGARRQDAWQRIAQANPRHAKDQEKTDRLLPVIRVVAVPETDN